GPSITLTLPDTSHYNTNYMLLLKDKLGNVTKPDGTGTSAYSAAAVKNGSNGWWCSEPAEKSFSAGSKIDGNNLEVELNGVDFAVSEIAVTATGVTGISGKVKFKDTDGDYKDVNCNYSNGTITITGGKYLSYDGSIKFTLTGGEGLAVPTSIKLNGSVEITTIGTLSFFAGFNRFRFGETDATELRTANTQEAPVRLTRNISVGDFFAAMDSPAYAESDNRVAFSVGKNMDAVVEGKKQEETVTVQEEFGYNNVVSDAENLPLQNLSWHAPDGPILEDAGQEEEALALNLSPEFNSSNQVLSASDAGNPQEESHGWNPALVVSLLSLLALGLVALCVRKRPVR
ncbi:MAG: hypothetical protein IKQ43_00320, partial [Treponema sp.]|nr:hypothetical protein [Treponema sp.]